MTTYYHGTTKSRLVDQYRRRADYMERHFGEPMPVFLTDSCDPEFRSRLRSGDMTAHDDLRRNVIANDRGTVAALERELSE